MRKGLLRQLRKADYSALASFRYLLRQFVSFSEDAARSEHLTAQQHQALLVIKGFPSRECVTIGELAEQLNVRHHSAVGLVDRLDVAGLIRRRQDREDRRRVWIELTNNAERRLSRLSHVHRQELRRLAPHLKSLLSQLQKRP